MSPVIEGRKEFVLNFVSQRRTVGRDFNAGPWEGSVNVLDLVEDGFVDQRLLHQIGAELSAVDAVVERRQLLQNPVPRLVRHAAVGLREIGLDKGAENTICTTSRVRLHLHVFDWRQPTRSRHFERVCHCATSLSVAACSAISIAMITSCRNGSFRSHVGSLLNSSSGSGSGAGAGLDLPASK